jgi:hypothetical protein
MTHRRHEVENAIFKVHRSFLVRYSAAIRAMSNRRQSGIQSEETDNHPLILRGDSAIGWTRLLESHCDRYLGGQSCWVLWKPYCYPPVPPFSQSERSTESVSWRSFQLCTNIAWRWWKLVLLNYLRACGTLQASWISSSLLKSYHWLRGSAWQGGRVLDLVQSKTELRTSEENRFGCLFRNHGPDRAMPLPFMAMRKSTAGNVSAMQEPPRMAMKFI